MQLKRKEALFGGLFYGKQESRNINIALDENFNIVERHLFQHTANNQNHVLLLGDFNAKIGNGEQDIRNGEPKITPNGKRLINLTNNFNLKILNKSPKFKDKWIRINTKNENEKSMIGDAPCTQALYRNLNAITIDEEGNYKLNGRSKTDHNSTTTKINKSTTTVKKN